MIKTMLFSVGFLAAAMLLFCVNILLKRNGTFRSQHIGQSKALRKRGIHCVQAQDFEARLNNLMAVEEKSRKEEQ
ncbi:MAG: hypothetical protein J5698_06205 [Bacteroidaceae bacterium]|nr:hypothetical protein [Bacteroidaceae bacterium]